MDIRITKPIQGGTVRAIASKSEAHRLLICAALSDCDTFLFCPERSDDIDTTADCLKVLGAVIRYENDGFFVSPIKRPIENKTYSLSCNESGSTLRFLLPICGALGVKTGLYMSGRLPQRPLSVLYDEMTMHGCTLSGQGKSPLTCAGQLKSGTYTLPGNISSQFISGLLFALPLLSGDSIIKVTGVLESRPYVDMTVDVLNLFGINIIEEKPNTFFMSGNQSYCSPKNAKVEGDWSNAAFWLSAGAIGSGSVTCTNLNLKSKQGDRAIIELLTRFGADVSCKDDSVTVSPGILRGINIDAGNTPDLVPVLSAVASVAEGTTTIRNAERLRIKESDRLQSVSKVLSDLGADITETEDGLKIRGKKGLIGGETESFSDHRLAMTAAVVSKACCGSVLIRGADSVRKSYPNFFDDFKAVLGGECEVL